MAERELSRAQRELLADAVEGTYLIEIRNAVGESGMSVEEYRRQVAGTLLGLVTDGLIDVSCGGWQEDASTPVDLDALRRRLEDGSAWDPDAETLLIIDASEAGRRAMSVPPAS